MRYRVHPTLAPLSPEEFARIGALPLTGTQTAPREAHRAARKPSVEPREGKGEGKPQASPRKGSLGCFLPVEPLRAPADLAFHASRFHK